MRGEFGLDDNLREAARAYLADLGYGSIGDEFMPAKLREALVETGHSTLVRVRDDNLDLDRYIALTGAEYQAANAAFGGNASGVMLYAQMKARGRQPVQNTGETP